MTPSEYRSRLRARLIELKGRGLGPANVDDVVAAPNTRDRSQTLIETADRRRPEQPRDLQFANGATLRLRVDFEHVAGNWSLFGYCFHFAKGERWFRYDRDPDRASGPTHPRDHLHVGSEEPRYPTGDGADPLLLLDFLEAQGLLR
ncbi:MAG: hypothetical protein HY744_16635 [Deltaproteobacteria bacterium]|nr:hypothetical protein [Deltaproteobacteria bacterium]